MRTAAGSVPDRYQSFVKTKELYQNWLGNSVAKANYLFALNLKTAVGGEFFLTQRRREAENAEKIASL